MFGTLKVSRCVVPSVYDRYKKYYCGLCSVLADNYGALSRALVNYDMTFLYLLLSAVTRRIPEPVSVFCPVSLSRKREAVRTPGVADFAAASNVYLVGMKLRDDLADEGRLKHRLAYSIFRAKESAARQQLTDMGVPLTEAERLFRLQRAAEERGKTLADFAFATEKGMGFLFAEAGKVFRLSRELVLALGEIGEALGRIVYILDSFVDYPGDIRCGRFNALAEAFGDRITLKEMLSPGVRKELMSVLEISLHQATAAVRKLQLDQDQEVVDAVLGHLEQRISHLIQDTRSMLELEEKIKKGTFTYLFTHPGHMIRSRTAARHRGRSGCCECDSGDLCTAWICCDAADCDCDTAEGCSQGDCCEFMECCG